MAQDPSQNTELTTSYAARVAADLAHNAQEQERVSAELAALHERLEALHDDRAVLVALRQTLTGASPATESARTAPTAADTTKPKTGKAAKATGGAGTAAQARAATQAQAQAQAQAAAQEPRAKRTPGPAQPTLGSLIRAYLSTQGGEPRSTAEVTEALAAAHPERGVKATVVRTTIEGLVAKSHVQRHKQGGSVFYTLTADTSPADTSGAADTPPATDTQPAADAPTEDAASTEENTPTTADAPSGTEQPEPAGDTAREETAVEDNTVPEDNAPEDAQTLVPMPVPAP